MNKKELIVATAFLLIAVVSAIVFIHNRSLISDDALFQANVEALSRYEQPDKEYNNARNEFCIIPAGAEGCKFALFRTCTLGIFCNE